jgi:Cof subfamily protein (haloacid dehalogenase superfamily)
MIQLVVLDLDGTLLDPHREAPIRPAVREAVQRTLEKGIGVTLATGRTWEYARHRQEELGLSLPMVASHGASVVARDGRILWESCLQDELAHRLAQQTLSRPETFSFYYRQRQGQQLRIALNRAPQPMEFYHHLLGRSVEVAADFSAPLAEYRVLKFVVFDEEADAVERWSDWAGSEAQVHRTHHLLVEGTAPGVDKGAGLRRLCQHLGIPLANVLAVGDNFNDLPMFEAAGRSVAMGQSPEAVRQAAHWIAPSFEEDGVAAALIQFT